MYTRSRQSQNFTGNQQQQRGGGNMQQQREQYQQQPYKQPGNYQGGNQNQQNYNQGGGGTPFKQQQQQQQQQPQQQPQGPLQHSTPQPQRLKPILKSSGGNVQGTPGTPGTPVTPGVQGQNQQFNQNQQQSFQQQQQQANNGVDNDDNKNDSMESDAQEIPKWRRKVPGLKVNRKLKRLRMNQRLRKTIQPKNAIMVLNEMKTGVQFTFPETQASLPNSLFLVHAEIEGKTYVGQGISKPLARQNAAENALKSLLLEKMTAAAMKARIDAESDNASNANTNVNAGEGTENKEGDVNMETEESDEIPWSSLASFALYKLFLEWQNQGTVVPVPRPGQPSGKVKKQQAEQPANKPVVQKELPANATTIHPVMLLNQMRPGLTYHEVSRVGNPPNTMFTLGVDIDGKEFTGAAKNKKDAKKNAAMAALHGLYDLVYPDLKEGEDVNMG